jgi:NAD(P)-dependent dehydrogenase (short-subunit alcohol dehydrogenase family)
MPQRNWLITGVSSGLGRALAQAVIAAGDRVTGTVRSAQAAAEIGALHPSWAVARVLDVTEFSAAVRIVDGDLAQSLVSRINTGQSIFATTRT